MNIESSVFELCSVERHWSTFFARGKGESVGDVCVVVVVSLLREVGPAVLGGEVGWGR